MFNLNKILYFLAVFLLTSYTICASQKDALNDELSEVIKRSFKEQICQDNFTENQLEVTPVIFNQEDAGHTLALFKVNYKLPEISKIFFVKFHNQLESDEILENLKIVKDYFSCKQLTHVTVVHDLWSGVANNYKFSVFPYINAPTLDEVVDSYLSQNNQNLEDLAMHSQMIPMYEKLGYAVGELHKSGLDNPEGFVSRGIRGDLHGGNILCHPTEGIFIIDNGTYAQYINSPATLATDLHTLFLQTIRLPTGFIEECIIDGEVKRAIQKDVSQWHVAFCRGYVQMFSENTQGIKDYLAQCTQDTLSDILLSRNEIFSEQDYKLFDISKCEEWIQNLIKQIQVL